MNNLTVITSEQHCINCPLNCYAKKLRGKIPDKEFLAKCESEKLKVVKFIVPNSLPSEN